MTTDCNRLLCCQPPYPFYLIRPVKIAMLVYMMVAIFICGGLGHNKNSNHSPESGKYLNDSVTETTARNVTGRQLYKELVDRLFEDYSPILPPNADDPSTTVNLSILMVLESLAYLDMKSQTLNIMAWFQIDWYDPAFSWDTHRYPVDMVVVSEKEVWRPVLAIANTLLPRDQIMKIELPVSLFSDGNVRWFPGDSFIMTCHMNLNFYPFDTQTCKVSLTQWSHHSHHFNCTQAEIRSSVSGNGEWDIVDLGYFYKLLDEPGYDFWVLVFTVTLKRKWVFYIINLMLPIILVSGLNSVVFILPVHTGDKMAVSVTSFLTLIVFLTMINDSQAKNSDTVCYLSLYLAVQVTLGAMAIVQSAILVACQNRICPVEDDHVERSSKKEPPGNVEPYLDGELPDSGVLNEDSRSTKTDNWERQCRHRDSLWAPLNHHIQSGRHTSEVDSETLNTSSSVFGENKLYLEGKINETTSSSRKGRQLYRELVDRLFEDYSPILPPNADDPSTTVNLSILMVLESLAYLDMKSQTLNIMAWFQIDWHDPAFSWDTHRYPVDMVVVSEKEVWRPVLAIANTLLPRDQIMKIELPVSLFSDGNVRWFPGDSFLMNCHMNLNFYPFDTQTCKVRLSQWSHHVRHFNCTQAAIRSSVKGNGEWDITDLGFYYDVTHEADYSYWILTYTITLQRKWGYYAINLIFPIILVSALNNVVFLLHVDSGDKMAVSVTTFLTLIVFLTMINDSLAKNSDTVCYLSLYLAVQSAIVVACHHRASADQDPKRDFKRKLSCINQQVPDQELPDGHRLNEDEDSVKVDKWIQSTNHDEISGIMPKTRYGQSTDRTASERTRRRARDMADSELIGSKRTSRDWTVIAARIDSICFPVFVGLNVMSLLVFCIVILSA